MSGRALSRGVEHLGFLGSQLAGLKGYQSLLRELIQNADDVPGVTWIRFSVTPDALVVDNDGVFSDCGEPGSPECRWKADSKVGHRCDFHRLRLVAGGDKRNQDKTTGAFGIGFISVYQITDAPEILSAGRHWVLREEMPESERIIVCKNGCEKCGVEGLPGTRFVLPWAFDENSHLRQALKASSLSREEPMALYEALTRLAPGAMIFLKNVEAIEVAHDGPRAQRFVRELDPDHVTIEETAGALRRRYLRLQHELGQVGTELKRKYYGLISETRSTKVSLAIPLDTPEDGLLYACLPTEQRTGLPFHVDADFFPSTDRRHVVLEQDYQSDWNRAALAAAAEGFGSACQQVRQALGPVGFWRTAQALRSLHGSEPAPERGQVFAQFWARLLPALKDDKCIFLSTGSWARISESRLLLGTDEGQALPVLEGLGIKVAHEDLRPFQNVLTGQDVGLAALTAPDVVTALQRAGLVGRIETSSLPTFLHGDSGFPRLWQLLVALLRHQAANHKRSAEFRILLSAVSIAPGSDGAFWPPREILAAEEDTTRLFSSAGTLTPFVEHIAGFHGLRELCKPFDVEAAVAALEGLPSQELEGRWREDRTLVPRLVDWFEHHRTDLLSKPDLCRRFKSLPLFPSRGSLAPLKDLCLPGGFDDPLGLATVVDLQAAGGGETLLRALKVQVLDLQLYLRQYLPAAIRDRTLTPEGRRAVAALLASRFSEMRQDKELKQVLGDLPLVECTDGEFRTARECCFASPGLAKIPGLRTRIIKLPEQNGESQQDLFTWLGATAQPPLADLVDLIREWTAQPPSADAKHAVEAIFAHLATRLDDDGATGVLEPLKALAWLPRRGDLTTWHKPSDLFSVFQAYLFETVGDFLDLSYETQRRGNLFLDYLGIVGEPDVPKVVAHLIKCAESNLEVNSGVYSWLSQRESNQAITKLRGRRCLYLDGQFRSPQQVFWAEHPFGKYRWRLPQELRTYSLLLTRLEVRETPDYRDAARMIEELSETFGQGNLPLDEEASNVLLSAWRLLGEAFGQGESCEDVLASLRKQKCVCRPDCVLEVPMALFFEDRAGLAEQFDGRLMQSVIRRPAGVAGLALEHVGVRSLLDEVETQLVECEDPRPDDWLPARLEQSRPELARVLYSALEPSQIDEALALVSRIRWVRVDRLEVRHRFLGFRTPMDSLPQPVPAAFLREEHVIYLVEQEGSPRWGAVARELAMAIKPGADPGPLAAGLQWLLQAKSVTEASQQLDDLGYPLLSPDQVLDLPGAVASQELGFPGIEAQEEESPPGGIDELPVATDTVVRDAEAGREHAATVTGNLDRRHGASSSGITPPDPGVQEEEERHETAGSPLATQGGPATPEQALAALLGPNAAAPTPLGGLGDRGQVGARSGGSGGSQKRRLGGSARQVLRSYVVPDAAASEALGNDQQKVSGTRSPVDLAGIQHVLAYEYLAGRTPREMPLTNPGYDIESRDATGNVARYIEVKSLSGAWRGTWATLSSTQFQHALRTDARYWLYVVEKATTDAPTILRINNPAGQASHFMFDDGWSVLAEADPDTMETEQHGKD